MTRLGWAASVGTVLAIIVGIALNWAEFITLAVAGAGALVLAALQSIGRSTYGVEIELATERVQVGEKLAARVVVQNRGRRTVLPAQLRVPVGENIARFALPALRPARSHDELVVIPTASRGVITLGPASSVRGDALGLIQREVAWTTPRELFVHPETVPLAGSGTGLMRDLEGRSLQIISDSDISFHTLREYIPGDDRRHIHWKTSAKIGELMVRQFDDTRRTRTALLLANHPDDFANEAEFELAVSVFASLGRQALWEDRELVPLCGRSPLITAVPARFLDECSRIGLGIEPRKFQQLPPWLMRVVPDASVAMLIVGSEHSPAQIQAQISRIDKAIMVVVIQCDRGAPSGARPLGDATLAHVSSLADLPRVMQRVRQ